MGRTVAMVGDGHTYLEMPPSFRRYPVRLYAFGDELRITHASADHEHLLGGRVRAIGETEIRRARELVRRQIAEENEWYVLRELPWFLVHAEILHANAVVPELDAAQWTIETAAGERLSVRLPAVEPRDEVRLISAAQATPLYRSRSGEDLWYEVLEDANTLYVGFRGYPARPAFRDFFAEVLRVAADPSIDRMMIDLRENRGGDFTKVRDLLLPALREHRINQRGRLFVAIGRSTFSAAMTNAADFLNETNAILAGEPTGGRPNGWQEKGELTLPNSQLAMSVSTEYYRFLDEDLPAVMPHRHVPLTWDAFQSGRDPVLEWIIAQPLPE